MTKKSLPTHIDVGGEVYALVLMKIQNRYENDTPEDLTLMPDGQMIEISGGEEFLTAYIPRRMLRERVTL